MRRIPSTVREQVRQRADYRCEYCHLPENYIVHAHQIDHIVARRHDGSDEFDNLAWACFYCNNGKGSDLSSIDPVSRQRAWLYNPRQQNWDEHFAIDSNGVVNGKTSDARATIRLLDINNAKRVELRKVLLDSGIW